MAEFPFHNLRIATLNLRSLNCSDLNPTSTFSKIEFLLNENMDIWFLTELKASCPNRVNDILKYLTLHSKYEYEIILNSSSASRGTGIMFKKSLCLNVVTIEKSIDENILRLSTTMNSLPLTFICVYAPSNANEEFFSALRNIVNSVGNNNVIVGGDWNCTPSPLPPQFNIDLESHPSPCNQTGSNFISNIMESNNLIDPFRHLFGDKKGFSFERKYPTYISRSRIDFFLIGENLGKFITDAGYKHTPRIFDHYICHFKLDNSKQKNKISRNFINHDVLNSPEFSRQCKIELLNFIVENYPEPPIEIVESRPQLNQLNHDIICIEKYLDNDYDGLLLEILNSKIESFSSLYNRLENRIADFDWNPGGNSSPSLLLLTLINNFKNIGHNLTSARLKSKRKFYNSLEKKLLYLRKNQPENLLEINETSEKLNTLKNLESENLFNRTNQFHLADFEKKH